MVHPPQRSALGGPALVRLLARLAAVDVSDPTPSLSDRLSQWLGWTDAIALSAALSVDPPADGARRPAGGDAQQLCAQVRRSLVNAIDGAGALAAGRTFAAHRAASQAAAAQADAADPAAVDYAVFRQDYLSIQQAMQADIGELRARLRRMLAAGSARLARLAVLDASFEQALDARERTLFASVPTLLGAYFGRLRNAEQRRLAACDTPDGAAASAGPGAWLDAFRNDMRSVLLAELEIRFQPVEGLLAALRTR